MDKTFAGFVLATRRLFIKRNPAFTLVLSIQPIYHIYKTKQVPMLSTVTIV